ncbi:hypothetical protein GS582_09735 [Rhodococcus hoagii]|nr:hypothetical protein [Prescottella equi]
MADSYTRTRSISEPSFGTRQPDGGWGVDVAKNLERRLHRGEHIQDRRRALLSKVGADLSNKLAEIEKRSN